MFGSHKKTKAKSVEEFLRSQDAGTPLANGGAVDRETDATGKETGAPRTGRWFVAPAVVAAGLLVLLCIAFVKIGNLKSDVALLRLRASGQPVGDLKAQVAALGSKIDKSDREAEQLKVSMARLEKDLNAMKLQNVRRQKVEAPAKKPSVDKKRPVKPAKGRT